LFERNRSPRGALPRWADRALFGDGAFARSCDVLCISEGMMFDFLRAERSKETRRLVRKRRVPYVVVCQHNNEWLYAIDPKLREQSRELLGGAHRVVFVAEHNRRLAERQLASALSNAVVLCNPVNLADAAPLPWPACAETVRLASVARLDVRFKGQDALLEALAGKAWRQRRWELRFYGTGPDEVYLRELGAFLGIAERLRFMGHAADIRSVWAENHLLVLPSWGEGTPLALVEAMLCGRAALVTEVGDNADWIDEGRTGFVAPAPTPGHLGAALERAWSAREHWPEMGCAARARASARRDPQPGATLLGLLEAAGTA